MFTFINSIAVYINRPIFWGFMYFGCLFTFPWIYIATDPEGFYHTTAKYEFEATQKEKEVSEIIGKSILNSNMHKYKNVTLKTSNVYANKITINGENVYFKVYIELETNKVTLGYVIPFYFEKDWINNYIKFDGKSLVDIPLLSTKEYPKLPLYDIKNEDITNAYINPPEEMSMTLEESKILKDYFNIIEGFPNNRNNSYGRMLYFSAVTITSLGYGDILPISDTNRYLITLESILGILLIGLFLNSLASKAIRPKTKPLF